MRLQFGALLAMPVDVAGAVGKHLKHKPHSMVDYPSGTNEEKKVIAASDADLLQAVLLAQGEAESRQDANLKADIVRTRDVFLRSAVGAK